MASRDITYCVKECDDVECEYNKKHLKESGAKDGDVKWWIYPECEKGELKVNLPEGWKEVPIKKVSLKRIQMQKVEE